jgi:hypothetical protein
LVVTAFLWFACPDGCGHLAVAIFAVTAAIECVSRHNLRAPYPKRGRRLRPVGGAADGPETPDDLFAHGACQRLLWGHRAESRSSDTSGSATTTAAAAAAAAAAVDDRTLTRGIAAHLAELRDVVASSANPKPTAANSPETGIGRAIVAWASASTAADDAHVVADALEHRARDLEMLAAQLDGADRQVAEFAAEYRHECRAVALYAERAEEFRDARTRIHLLGERMQCLARHMSRDVRANGRGGQRSSPTGGGGDADGLSKLSREARAHAERLRADIESSVPRDLDLLLAVAAGDGNGDEDDSKRADHAAAKNADTIALRPSLVVLFQQALTEAQNSQGVHPRFLAPASLAAVWVQYYSLYGTFLAAANLLTEAAHLGVAHGGEAKTAARHKQRTPRLPRIAGLHAAADIAASAAADIAAKIARGLRTFDQLRARYLPHHLPLRDAYMAFWIDPGFAPAAASTASFGDAGGDCDSNLPYALTATPIGGADRRWTADEARRYLATATLSGYTGGWRLPTAQLFESILGEARALGVRGHDSRGDAHSIMHALGFRLPLLVADRPDGNVTDTYTARRAAAPVRLLRPLADTTALAPAFLTTTGWFRFSDDSPLGKRHDTPPPGPLHLLAWRTVASDF